MQFDNLEINILYVLCRSTHDRIRKGSVRTQDVNRAFSDIPESDIRSVILSMAKEKLITLDPTQARIGITPYGIQRFEESIACKIHKLENCKCHLEKHR